MLGKEAILQKGKRAKEGHRWRGPSRYWPEVGRGHTSLGQRAYCALEVGTEYLMQCRLPTEQPLPLSPTPAYWVPRDFRGT